MGYEGIPKDNIRLLLISSALRGKAREWLDMLPPNTITTWEEFLYLFLKRNISMTTVLIAYKGLSDFKQETTETLGQAWERFKRIL